MPEPPYRALRIFLRVFSLLAVAGGLLMIFAGKPLIVRIFLRPPEGEVTTLLLSLLKEMGGIVESAQAFHKCARFCNAATAQDASSHVASALVGVDEENFLVIENRATPKWWLVHSSREGGKSREMEKA